MSQTLVCLKSVSQSCLDTKSVRKISLRFLERIGRFVERLLGHSFPNITMNGEGSFKKGLIVSVEHTSFARGVIRPVEFDLQYICRTNNLHIVRDIQYSTVLY